MKKICVLTGTRAEYGLLKPTMTTIKNHSNFKLSIIVTGMHLSPEFGNSIKEIEKDGFKITAKVKMNPVEDTGFSMAESVGKGIIGVAKSLEKIKPDILLVLGDRTEALSGAIAAAYMNIPIAHIHGGDIVGAVIDESARHAITKLAHIHFPGTKKSAERIIKMGENRRNIYIVGTPCVETILNKDFLTKKEIEKKFDLDLKKPLILMLQHSVSTQIDKAKKQIIETLEAVKKLQYQTVIIYPNSDAGGREIIKQIKKYECLPFVSSYKNLSQKEYFSLLKYCSVMVGNSSSGIIESSSFKIPVINIGIRQDGRERSSNVIDVNHNRVEIIRFIEKAINDKKFREKVRKCKNPYGTGRTSEKIVKILNQIDISPALLEKKLTY